MATDENYVPPAKRRCRRDSLSQYLSPNTAGVPCDQESCCNCYPSEIFDPSQNTEMDTFNDYDASLIASIPTTSLERDDWPLALDQLSTIFNDRCFSPEQKQTSSRTPWVPQHLLKNGFRSNSKNLSYLAQRNEDSLRNFMTTEDVLLRVLDFLSPRDDWEALERTSKLWYLAVRRKWHCLHTADVLYFCSDKIDKAKTAPQRRAKVEACLTWLQNKAPSIRHLSGLGAAMERKATVTKKTLLGLGNSLRNLQELDLANCRVEPDYLAVFCRVSGNKLRSLGLGDSLVFTDSVFTKAKAKSITEKHLTVEKQQDDNDRILSTAFSNLKKLEKLDISHCECAHGHFLHSLPNPQLLKCLDIRSCRFVGKEVANFIPKCINLQVIFMDNYWKKTKVSSLITPSFNYITGILHSITEIAATVKVIDFGDLFLTNAPAISKLFQASINLEVVRCPMFSFEGKIETFDALVSNCLNLRELWTSFKGLEPKHVRRLTDLKKMRYLMTGFSPIDHVDDVIRALAEVKSLEVAHFRRLWPRANDAYESFFQLTKLKEIHFQQCRYISNVLPCAWTFSLASSLQALHLNNCIRLDSDSVNTFLSVRGEKIKELSLTEAAIYSETFSKIGAWCPNLRSLRLGRHNVSRTWSQEDLDAVQTIIFSCKNLKFLALEFCQKWQIDKLKGLAGVRVSTKEPADKISRSMMSENYQ